MQFLQSYSIKKYFICQWFRLIKNRIYVLYLFLIFLYLFFIFINKYSVKQDYIQRLFNCSTICFNSLSSLTKSNISTENRTTSGLIVKLMNELLKNYPNELHEHAELFLEKLAQKVSTDAIDRFKEEQFLIALDSGFYGSEFHNDKTGEVKYLIATVQDEKADWMNDENKLPNLAEAISNDIVEGK